MKEYVIDTSVAVKWFCENEEDVENAFRLRQQLLDGSCFLTVPDFLIYELANALKHNPNFTTNDVKVALDSVFDMGLDIRMVDSSVIGHAIGIAFRFNVTIYDSYFIAISQIERKPFISADYKFIERIKGFKNIIRLSEIK